MSLVFDHHGKPWNSGSWTLSRVQRVGFSFRRSVNIILLISQVDSDTYMFEKQMSQLLLESRDFEPVDTRVEVNVANSFGDIASSTIWGDVTNLILGFSIVFIYVNFMLGKFNMVEQRVSLYLCPKIVF